MGDEDVMTGRNLRFKPYFAKGEGVVSVGNSDGVLR
jgi:hypothetical protein